VLRIRIRDPGSGAFLPQGSGSGIKDGRIRIQDPGYQKMVGSGSGIRDKHPGSATLVSSCSDGYVFLNLKGLCSLKSKNVISALKGTLL
jgi:hypothetical protein